MKHPWQAAVVAAVIICIASGWSLVREPVLLETMTEISFEGWTPPRYARTPDAMTQGLDAASNPFARRLFESMTLKGFVRHGDAEFSAMFLDGDGRLVTLRPGSTQDGVTLVSADGRGCTVRCGVQTREFMLKRAGDR